ncbi:cysteine synthase A [Gammaproteobacteria bacterium]|nr:cysteine synthase A [Gammaproteobacteria bacterium]MDA9868258.1 cysteine synthase A [Gammaproteobacteria bacterium]MDB9909110.1 cysteine synthase A [Gammaproteobacteria bacterium]MDC3398149.1 cysteine synthase A [Gammaproteobacteria bacterium]
MITDFIGNTPLIKLNYFSEISGCNIYGKAEFMNPGGSIKDRAAKYIIDDAIKRKLLKAGGTIVEGTAGNTGIGLALVGNAYNLRTIIVIPDTQAEEKKLTLRACGAELIEVPAVPYKDDNNYVKYSKKVAESQINENGVLWANQFDNEVNFLGHLNDTGPEILRQLSNEVDGFVCSCGTGGTLTGVSIALRNKNPNVNIAIADPMGAALYNYYANGELKSEGSSITEGIGQGRITRNLEELKVDFPFQIDDKYALDVMFKLVEKEGLFLGGSSGINVAGALELAKRIGPGKNIVTILCDSGSRYQTKLYNRNFLVNNDLPCPEWL